MQRQAVRGWGDILTQNDFTVRFDPLELGSSLSPPADFKCDVVVPVPDEEVRRLLATGSLEILQTDVGLPHCQGEKIFAESSHRLIHSAIQQTNRRHEHNLGLAKDVGSGRENALKDKCRVERTSVLFRLVFRDAEVGGKRSNGLPEWRCWDASPFIAF